jgi:NitT/TauT family transport system permease protein
MIGGTEDEPASWVYSALRSAGGLRWIGVHGLAPLGETLDRGLLRRFPAAPRLNSESGRRNRAGQAINLVLLLGVAYGAFRAASMLLALPWPTWVEIWTGVTATLLRVSVALGLALAWTIPVGVAIGTNRRLATMLQPVVQITASVPATALFPVFLLFLLDLPGGLNLAAVLLMLLGTQWYLLFNIIAGASAIPQDLKYTATLIQLNGWRRWRTLILPALFPYIVTGAITASGGAWNASIVAEYVAFNGRTFYTQGIGSQIAQATASGNYTHLLAATLSMVLAVVLINRFVWRRLYRLAEEKYRME